MPASRQVPVLAIVGEDEQARGEVAVRDLQTRQQTDCSRGPSPRARIAQTRPAGASRRERARDSGPTSHQVWVGVVLWLNRLATLQRTHTCGALRILDVGADVVLARLGASRPRPRRRPVPRHPRPAASRRSSCATNDALLAAAKRLRPEFVVGIVGTVQRRTDDTVNPKLDDRRGRGAGATNSAAQRGEDAAVPDRGRRAGVGGRAAALPLPGPAPAAPAARTSGCATAWRSPSGSTSTRRGSGRSRRRS